VESLKHKVVNLQGAEVSTIDLDPAVFQAKVDKTLVHATVRWQLTKRRSGTHQALTRSMMKGGGKKPFRQKGTGRARAGSIISPLWVGGASVHGPLPRSYEHRLPKRTRRQALASVLTDKFNTSQLVIVDSLTGAQGAGKTKTMAAALKKLGAGDGKIVVVLPQGVTLSDTAGRSLRNLSNVVPLHLAGVNVYDLLRTGMLVCTVDSIQQLQLRVKGELVGSSDDSDSGSVQTPVEAPAKTKSSRKPATKKS
jgi:large subunit ribosomal protein L4